MFVAFISRRSNKDFFVCLFIVDLCLSFFQSVDLAQSERDEKNEVTSIGVLNPIESLFVQLLMSLEDLLLI